MDSSTHIARSDGQHDRQEPKRERPAQDRGRPAHAAVLALQRAAGNAAVAHLLGGERGQSATHLPPTPPVVQRNGKGKRKAPDNTPPFTSTLAPFAHTTNDTPPQVWVGERPVTVQGPVVSTRVESRGPTATPQAYKQTGPGGISETRRLLGYDGGHVIGLHLGGQNISGNVVPMYPAFNRGVWKNMEDATKNDAAERGASLLPSPMAVPHPEFPRL
ncbi:MAG: DNA/RNA non-specific endonuclease [Pseudonocardiaceae bacterium]